MKSSLRPVWVFGALLMLADALTTHYGLQQSGVYEGNAFMAAQMVQFGLTTMLVTKVLVGTLCVWVLAWLSVPNLLTAKLDDPADEPKANAIAAWMLVGVVVLMGMVIGNNLAVLQGVS